MTLSRIALITSLLALTASTAFAGIVRVGPNRTYTTIQDGVDHASAGDKILIDKGIYVETVVVTTADLTIQPAKKGKKGKVTISGGGAGTPLAFLTGANDCIARNLTIVESMDYGIVFSANTGVKIIGCTVSGGADIAGIVGDTSIGGLISKCKVKNVDGIGILIDSSIGHVVTKCTVSDGDDSGILVNQAAMVTIINNNLTNISHEGIHLGPSADAVGCLVSGNKLVESSDAIRCGPFSSLCVIEKNTSRQGWRGVVTDEFSAECLVMENKVDGAGSDGFFMRGSNSTFLKNKITDSEQSNYDFHSDSSYLSLTKNKSRRAGEGGFELEGNNHALIKNDSRKSGRVDPSGLDFETSSATDCAYVGNSYDTSDF